MTRIGKHFDVPLLANMVDGGRTPVLTRDRLEALGYAIAIFPGTGFLAAGAALRAAYGRIRDTGSSAGIETALYGFADFNKLMGFEAVWEFDRRHAED
jgi:2-methylisocitrate lyase-like PEP mutase family enzyme